jgi:hypothetical protein
VALALLAAMVLPCGSGVTGAHWTASGMLAGTTVRSGTLDLRIDGQDAIADYAPLDIGTLVPGAATASVITVTNVGDVPLDYTLESSGTDPDGRALLAQLAVRVTAATAVTPSGAGSTCAGVGLPDAPRTLAAGQTDKLCVQVGLPATAPVSVAGGATTLSLTVAAVSGGWSDPVVVGGSTVSAATLTAPTVTCGTGLLGSIGVNWSAVPGATGYVVRNGLLGSVLQTLGLGALGTTVSGLVGDVSVQAVFGSPDWVSPPSAPRHVTSLAGLLGTCS